MKQEVYEIRKTSISTKDGETFACIDLVEKYHELLNKIKTRNSKAIACLSKIDFHTELLNQVTTRRFVA